MTLGYESKFFTGSLSEKVSDNGTSLTEKILDASYFCSTVYLIVVMITGAVLNTKALILLNRVDRVGIE